MGGPWVPHTAACAAGLWVPGMAPMPVPRITIGSDCDEPSIDWLKSRSSGEMKIRMGMKYRLMLKAAGGYERNGILLLKISDA